MTSALLITLREGLEASLIVGIIFAYLNRTGNRRAFKPVWLGTGLAIITSVIVGALIYRIAGEFTGKAEQIFEGTAVFIAAIVLTWMIFWMRKQARNIRQDLQAQIQASLQKGSSSGLVLLSFVAVVREGIETALFLFAATKTTASGAQSITGGLIGLAAALILGYGIYKGTSKLNLRVFFNITGMLLILFAAGLVVRGVQEFQEAGIIAPVVEHVWDFSGTLPSDTGFGGFLSALFGYNALPSLVEIIVYCLYLGIAFAAYFYRGKKQAPPAAKTQTTG